MNQLKVWSTVLIVSVCLSTSFISPRKKNTKVELTKYFETSEGYGNHVAFIDQHKWISANNGVLYLWEKQTLKKTFNTPVNTNDRLVVNASARKVYAGNYTLDLTNEALEPLTDLRMLLTEGLESAPSPSAGYFGIVNSLHETDGSSELIFTRFFPSRGLNTTSYAGIRARLLWIDPAAGKLKKVLWESEDDPGAMELFITDKYLVAAGETLLIFDKTSGSLLREIEHGTYAVLSIAFNHSGTLMAVGKADGTIKLFKANDEWTSSEVHAHNSRVLTLSFHPALDLLISGSEDKTLKIWKAENGKLAPVKEQKFDDPVEGVTFDAEGKRLAVSKKFEKEAIQLFNVKVQ